MTIAEVLAHALKAHVETDGLSASSQPVETLRREPLQSRRHMTQLRHPAKWQHMASLRQFVESEPTHARPAWPFHSSQFLLVNEFLQVRLRKACIR